MRWMLFVALLLVMGPISGCLSSNNNSGPSSGAPTTDAPSEAQFDILKGEQVWVLASDGKRIHNVVYRPDTAEPVGTFINFSPYWGDTAATKGDAFSSYMIDEYVPRGFAVILSAIRGTGHSEGCFSIGGDRESRDVNEVVDFFSKQSWSNGRFAAGGKSYDSTSQNGMIAKFPHDALKGLFHVSGITDMYRYTMHDGVPYGSGSRTISFTPGYYAGQGLDEYTGTTNGAGSPSNEDPESIARIVDDVACTELPGHVANPVASAAAGAKTPYWVERDYTRFIGSSSWNGSIFFVHGLQDWNVQPDHIQPWMDQVLAKGDIEVLGWLHQWQQGGTGHVYPMRGDWNETMLLWMDQVLKGKNSGLHKIVGFESQGTDGNFRRSTSWPPAPAINFTLADLTSTCKTGCARTEVTLLTADLEGMRIAGSPVARVSFQTQTEDPVLTAVLYKQNATGRSWVGEGTIRGVYRNGLETPSPVTIGSTYTVDIALYPLDGILTPGDSWVLVFGAPVTKGATVVPAALRANPVVPSDALYTLTGATLTATVLPESVGRIVQPEPMRCFAC